MKPHLHPRPTPIGYCVMEYNLSWAFHILDRIKSLQKPHRDIRSLGERELLYEHTR
jgi:hypothetical protein